MTSIAVTEAKGRLSSLLHDAETEDVTLLRHGRPAGVLVSPERYQALVEAFEDAVDAAVVAQFLAHPEPTVPVEEAFAGLD
ncbi:type II toxin-antitoxin system Phd/YefM family antitoxin [uncultured Friedmanniella sp.]|uniref:type II toxin-antitoxin system Phd/YefM family antitoxin n=1 Tax=uncultured Friedmanniella sp. TaxID=335381 RepID=UPI0035CB7B39